MEMQNNWKWVRLSGAVNILDNLRRPVNSVDRQKRNFGKKNEELFPYYGATSQVGWIDDYLTNGEYVLVGEDGAPFLDSTKPKSYLIKGKSWVNNHAHILQGISNVTNNRFILHYLNSINYRDYVNGTTRLKLTKSSLAEIPFPIPPIKIQESIVSKIEELFSELDKAIEYLQLAQKQLKTYRQAVLKWAFEGRLTNENVKEGELPEGWKSQMLKEIVDKISDGPFGSNLKSADYVANGVRVIRLENIGELVFKNELTTYITDEKYQSIKNHSVFGGDIIFSSFIIDSIRATILPDTLGTAVNKADCFLIRPSKQKAIPQYIVYFLASRNVYTQLKNEVHGATRPRINTTQLKELLVPIASIKEQAVIVELIDSWFSMSNKLEDGICDSLLKIFTLKQSILKKAFAGELALN